MRQRMVSRLALFICIAIGTARAAVTVAGRVVDENGAPLRDVSRYRFGCRGFHRGYIGCGRELSPRNSRESGNYRVEAQSVGYFLFVEPSAALSESVPLADSHLNRLTDLASSVDVHC